MFADHIRDVGGGLLECVVFFELRRRPFEPSLFATLIAQELDRMTCVAVEVGQFDA